MEKIHEEAIRALGFNEKESKTYLSLLEGGVSSATDLSKKTGLKRPTVYVVLEELVQRGAVFVVPESKKKLYRALSPQNLFEAYENKLILAKRKLPEIQALSKQESYKPHAILFEGIEGVKKALLYKMSSLANKTIKGFFAKTTPDIMKKFDNYSEYNNLIKKNNTVILGIAPRDPSLKSFRANDAEFGRNFLEISSDEYSSDVSIEITDRFVRFFDPVNLQALIIENSAIAKTMSQVFDLLFKNLSHK